MTINSISFRDFIRGEAKGDVLKLVDKKSKKEKGLYISNKYANEVLEFLKQKAKEEKEQKKRALLDFVGEFGDGEEFKDMSHKEIKAVIAYEKVCERYDTLVTSENILTTIEYIASKNGTDCKTVWKFFYNLTQNFEIVNFSEILKDALDVYKEKCHKNIKIDFEDLLQIESAIKKQLLCFFPLPPSSSMGVYTSTMQTIKAKPSQ